jgi:hypothetical protein
MFKVHYGICVLCNQEGLLVVRKLWCDKCNYEQKQNKKKLAGKKSGKYKYIKKATGEKELFEQIAIEREWKCFVTGQTLWELKSSQFSHVLPKALNKFPLFKLNPDNIVLLSDEAHRLWDFGSREELKKDSEWDKMFKLEAELKKQYKKLYGKT